MTAAKDRLQDVFSRTSSHAIEPYIAVTIEDQPDCISHQTLYSAGSCAWATALPTYVVSSRAMRLFPDCHNPSQLKLRLLDLFPEAETILFFSASVFFVCKQDFSRHQGTEELVYARSEPTRLQLMGMIKHGIPFSRFLSSDLLIFSRRAHSDFFAQSRDLRRKDAFSSAGPEILLNRTAMNLSLSTRCLGALPYHALDPVAPSPAIDCVAVQLASISRNWSLQDLPIRQQLFPHNVQPLSGKLDRKHYARPIRLDTL